MPNSLKLTIKTKGTVIYIIRLVEFDFVTNWCGEHRNHKEI